MKIITSITIAVALFGAVPVVANAQNAPTTNTSPSPASVNKSSRATMPSGTESRATATGARERVAGHGRFCKQTAGKLDCFYATFATCQKHSKSDNLRCVTNPDRT